MRSHDESTAPNGALLLSSADNLIPKLLTTEANLESNDSLSTSALSQPRETSPSVHPKEQNQMT